MASDVVRDVAADGDPRAARIRLRKLAHVAGLNLSAEASALAEELAAKHGNTVESIFEHYRAVQRTSGRTYVSYPAKRVEP